MRLAPLHVIAMVGSGGWQGSMGKWHCEVAFWQEITTSLRLDNRLKRCLIAII